ncbi:unnamed protein product [Periconia digitata]|uniref:Oxysterol-binding protein n=1 Tax=Periconia digitata TaxID=1303443 RepID=A0A9W4U3T2_9PLEO|nr:unnamed protein product [Periconia digitata]
MPSQQQPSPPTTPSRSTLKEFLASIATIQGDLSNITAPPFVLGSYSTTELPQYWGDHPNLFVAPAQEPDAGKRAALVLKWFLGSLRNQQYAGRDPSDGVKKPLNAFLGEIFMGKWDASSIPSPNNDNGGENPGDNETTLISEQVSHHPPVTACRLSNAAHGIHATGFTQQEITFSGTVSIKQKGYAILHIDRFDEDFLIPVPNVKVRGILSGAPYPELVGTYSIVSSSGFVAEVKFEGKGFLGGGTKNGFDAKVYKINSSNVEDSGERELIYTATGQWNSRFSIVSTQTGKEIDAFDAASAPSRPITVVPRDEQDPWESRRAWGGVIDALNRGDMQGTVAAKSRVEEGQRGMRRAEKEKKETWKQVFFRKEQRDERFERLVKADRHASFNVDPQGGIWMVDIDMVVKGGERKFHEGVAPDGSRCMKNDKSDGDDHEDLRSERREEVVRQRQPSNEIKVGDSESVSSRSRSRKDSKQEADRKGSRDLSSSSSSLPSSPTTIGGVTHINSQLENIQIEEMLRNKYSSARR